MAYIQNNYKTVRLLMQPTLRIVLSKINNFYGGSNIHTFQHTLSQYQSKEFLGLLSRVTQNAP